MQKAWSESLGRREREKDSRLARRQKSAEAERQDSAGAPGGDGSLGRKSSSSSRRDRTSAGLGSFDVVRSEEEMNAVLAQLAEQEKKEKPSVRSGVGPQRTAQAESRRARPLQVTRVPLPPMILSPTAAIPRVFHGGRRNLIEDSETTTSAISKSASSGPDRPDPRRRPPLRPQRAIPHAAAPSSPAS